MTYLIVGVDEASLVTWHEHIGAGDVTAATQIARDRAAAQGIRLTVVAVIGPNWNVLAPGDAAAASAEGVAPR